MDIKTFLDIPNYEGKYKIDESGNIYSCITKKILKPMKNKGYYVVDLCNNGKVKRFFVHRLVAETFIPNPQNKPTVDHINRIRTDNRVENLRWATVKEQSKNKNFENIILSLVNTNKMLFSKPIEKRDKKDHSLLYDEYSSVAQASMENFGKLKTSHITECANGLRKSAYGYWWCYKGDFNESN